MKTALLKIAISHPHQSPDNCDEKAEGRAVIKTVVRTRLVRCLRVREVKADPRRERDLVARGKGAYTYSRSVCILSSW